MSFVQIIDMRTKNVDEIQNLEREWEKATEGKRTLRRSIIGRDRNDPDHYLVLLLEGPMQFIDLDVIDDRS